MVVMKNDDFPNISASDNFIKLMSDLVYIRKLFQ